MKKFIYMLIAAMSLAGSSKVFADFDFIVFGDISGSKNDMHGSTYVGGNISGGAQFGSNYSGTFPDGYALVVNGDFNTSNEVKVSNNGKVLYGGGLGFTLTENNSGGTTYYSSQNGVIFDKASVGQIESYGITQSNYQALASYYSASSTEVLSSLQGLSFSGSDGVAVHYYSMEGSVFGGNYSGDTSLKVVDNDTDNNDIYIINVSGTDVSFGNMNFSSIDNSLASRIIWNFYEADTVNLPTVFYGSVLAVNADLTYGTNNIHGSIVVDNLYGNGEIYATGGTFPEVPAVPVPSAVLLSSFGMVCCRKFRQR